MGRVGQECHGVRQHPVHCLRDHQRKVERHTYRKRATEIGRSVLMAMLVVVMSVIMGAAGVPRLIGMVVAVGLGHRLAFLRPANWDLCRAVVLTRQRINGGSPLPYNMKSVAALGSSRLLNGTNAVTETLKIGELATRTGCPVETIRYYEHERLLSAPVRSNGNYRIYGKAHVERLSFIRHCRSLDMALDEIRTLLRFRDAPQENCDGANQLLDEHIGHVAARIADLNILARQLKSLRRQCGEAKAARDCGILNKLGQTKAVTATSNGRSSGHVRGSHPRGGRKV